MRWHRTLRVSDYHAPLLLSVATELLAGRKEALVIAGGTEAVLRLRNGAEAHRPIIAISKIEELRAIEETRLGTLRVGALVTCADIAASAVIARLAPLLAAAALSIGGPQIRNCATVGGNIALRCARSDLLPALLALDATVMLASQGGTRKIALAEYLAEPAQSTELITAVEFERAPSGTCFLRMSPRQSLAPAIANVAVLLRPTPDVERWDHVRIALGGVAGVAIRSRRAEQILAAAPCADEEAMRVAAAAAQDDLNPQSDSWASQWYRCHIVGVLVRRAIEAAGASART